MILYFLFCFTISVLSSQGFNFFTSLPSKQQIGHCSTVPSVSGCTDVDSRGWERDKDALRTT